MIDLQKSLKILLIRILIHNRFDFVMLNIKNKLEEGHQEIRQLTLSWR